jgi:hypothetical protein
MMDAEIDINTDDFDRFCDQVIDSLDPSQGGAMETAALESMDAYFSTERQRFDVYSERGGDWAEHAPSTIRKRGENAPILIEGGDLRESMNRDGDGHVIEVSPDGVVEGTINPVAHFHQSGTEKMPARKILDEPNSETLDEMKAPLVVGVIGAVRQVTFR